MGRIMSFDQDGRRVRDFDKSEYDFLRRYGRTPEEVMDENAKLVVKLNAEHIVRQNVEIENTKLRELARRLLDEYRYMRVRPRRMYLEHETRMRIIEDEMRSLGIEVTA